LKNAAFVKMRDSVSFCKQILIEYVLRNPGWVVGPLYMPAWWSVRTCGTSHDFACEGLVGLVGIIQVYSNFKRLVDQVYLVSVREL